MLTSRVKMFSLVHISNSLGTINPVVELCAFFPGVADDAALEKVGKEMKAASRRCTTLLGGGHYQMLTVDAPNVPAATLLW